MSELTKTGYWALDLHPYGFVLFREPDELALFLSHDGTREDFILDIANGISRDRRVALAERILAVDAGADRPDRVSGGEE